MPAVPVGVATVKQRDFPVYLTGLGSVQAFNTVGVKSRVDGQIMQVNFREGQDVRKGELLIVIDERPFQVALAQAQANLQRDEAQLQNAKAQYERNKALHAEGIISRQDFDNSQYTYRNIQAKTDSLEQAYDLVKVGPREEDIDAMKAQVQQARGVLAFDQDELNNTVIRAPIDGCVLERAVERGEYVTTGFVGDKGAKGYVVTLADLNDLQVELDIAQNDFARLHLGQNGMVTTDAYPDRKYDGKLIEISPKANRDKATVQVKVEILHPDAYLRPDMNASVAFVEPRAQGNKIAAKPLIIIPSSAIRNSSVFVVADGKALRRKVRVSRTTSDGAQIDSGLIGGEDLIVDPPPNLNDGQRIHQKGQKP